MYRSSIVYLDAPGGENTDIVLDAVAERLSKGDISHVVVASDSGSTGMKAVERMKGMGVKVVVVTEHCGSDKEGENSMSAEMERKLIENGATIVRATHALSGVERSISKKLGGSSRVEAIAEALRALFGQGMKVAVEITVMAADGGAIPCGDAPVIAVAGTEWGADTACVIRPAHSNGFFNLRVLEMLAIPRRR
ncbi:MAG: pyruvate kinase alpha/beta domain-containing protein [Thermoplasmata archaeon]